MNAKQYTVNINTLFKEWKKQEHHRNSGFITDGIVNYSKWVRSKKILFILKEPYSNEDINQSWHLPDHINYWEKEHLKKNPLYKMLSMWLFVLNNTTIDSYPKKITEDHLDQAYEYLKTCALINIKKCIGGSSSKMNTILKYAESDKDFLKQQIEMISPNIILCGNTYDSLKKIYKINDNENRYSEYCINFEGKTIIDFWHPSRKCGRELDYSIRLGKDYKNYLKKLQSK